MKVGVFFTAGEGARAAAAMAASSRSWLEEVAFPSERYGTAGPKLRPCRVAHMIGCGAIPAAARNGFLCSRSGPVRGLLCGRSGPIMGLPRKGQRKDR